MSALVPENPYETKAKLSVPAEDAWAILASPAGARLWLGDSSHPGVRTGAAFPLPDSVPAQIGAVSREKSFELSFPSGRRAVMEFADLGGDQCTVSVRDYGGDGRDTMALSDSWSAVLTAAVFVVNQAKANRNDGRQAIIVIHGVGSQRPLSTIKSFTHALIGDATRWSKPDQISDSYELRRYQLPREHYRPRTDLFELYWADEVPGTKVGQVLSWLRSIMLRRPKMVSAELRPIAYLTWGTLILLALSVVAIALTLGISGIGHLVTAATGLAKLAWVGTALSLAGALVSAILIGPLGDAARYLDAAPDNIAVRQSIRQHGVDLLRRLHEEGGYDRIAIVGHSLGSVIGYDIIRLYWSRVHTSHGQFAAINQAALKSYRRLLAEKSASGIDLNSYRQAQRSLWREYRRHGHPWLVTDLVTVGSPLAHAGTLLARSPAELDMLMNDLELPTCPPRGEPEGLTLRDTFLVDGNIRTMEMLTHAAPFAVTRWTNIYAPASGIVFGDPIGGPLAPVFGSGVMDVPVTMSSWWRRRTPLAHTSYWRQGGKAGAGPAMQALREWVDLEAGRWMDQHLKEMPWTMSLQQPPAQR
jgi:hypothetical protein